RARLLLGPRAPWLLASVADGQGLGDGSDRDHRQALRARTRELAHLHAGAYTVARYARSTPARSIRCLDCSAQRPAGRGGAASESDRLLSQPARWPPALPRRWPPAHPQQWRRRTAQKSRAGPRQLALLRQPHRLEL